MIKTNQLWGVITCFVLSFTPYNFFVNNWVASAMVKRPRNLFFFVFFRFKKKQSIKNTKLLASACDRHTDACVHSHHRVISDLCHAPIIDLHLCAHQLATVLRSQRVKRHCLGQRRIASYHQSHSDDVYLTIYVWSYRRWACRASAWLPPTMPYDYSLRTNTRETVVAHS